MPIKDRLLAALCAPFFLHIWWCHVRSMSSSYPDLLSTQQSFISPASFKILNRLCDTMVLLGLIYAEHYPDQPFCPWLLGTNLLEHFFGTARSLVPNFTYPELLKLVVAGRFVACHRVSFFILTFLIRCIRNPYQRFSFTVRSIPLSTSRSLTHDQIAQLRKFTVLTCI